MKPLRIHILCGNAAYNRGDRGNLASQIALMREAFPHAVISYDSYRPQVDRNWYDAHVVRRGWLLSWPQWKALRAAHVVVWGGGALIADNSCRTLIPMWVFILFVTKIILRKPILAWAHGTVIQTNLGRWLAKIAYALTDVITVRDQNSLVAVKRLKVRRPLRQTADPALLLKGNSAAEGESILRAEKIPVGSGRPLIAISPTFWPLYHRGNDLVPYLWGARTLYKNRNHKKIAAFKQALVSIGKALADEYDATLLFLPRYPSGPWPDLRHLSEVVQQIGPGRAHLFANDSLAPEAYLSIYRHFDLLITTALHDAIFATAVQTPCLQLYYEPKGRDFFEALSLTDRMANWEILFTPQGVVRVMEMAAAILNSGAAPSPTQLAAVEALRRRAGANVRILKRQVTAWIP